MTGRIAAGAACLLLLAGCAPSAGPARPTGEAPAAREGRSAASERITFMPERVRLPGGQAAPVDRARTVEGELAVPEDVRHVGGWDGSSSVNDVLGNTVIAGHVDSASAGLGYFARLLRVEPGELVTVEGDGLEQVYRVASVESRSKQSLAVTGDVFDQDGAHRLVLITCTGTFRPGVGYDSNLIVVAEPVGETYGSRT